MGTKDERLDKGKKEDLEPVVELKCGHWKQFPL